MPSARWSRPTIPTPDSVTVGPVLANGILQSANGQWYLWGDFNTFNGEPRVGLVRVNPDVGAQFSALGNISVRSFAGTGAQSLIVGFVTEGYGMNMLLRGVGPGLADFGVTGVLADPQLTLFDPSGYLQLSDNNWGNDGAGPAIAAAESQVGRVPPCPGLPGCRGRRFAGPRQPHVRNQRAWLGHGRRPGRGVRADSVRPFVLRAEAHKFLVP